ncbi:MAG: sulfite exporter TauE/SafE family protein [Moorea sp. SIO4G2]|uniref:sulfite exporter TauE/SafE family protein n=1 Tax=unclassified Moorena TaxID=2683338 RepID=UPI0013CCF925|nr:MULTISPECIES: sulfite exporter TauE/SafE family protein [unclassified Moorena]NEO13694.1 sulfite exporter TauE/SafE family protein [Moorena sp. SIO3E8]NEO24800.1 sulfite exporter TauE/SafE family protein [Moorena sp. SIO4A5]NEO61928.1 sulfite exporter TauE/SafE family protein [Moorena sp. SIO4G2]NEP98360.1 sulfite exporter TauE/SafE family protein [Moorena sp. SIO3F7]
MLLLLLALTSVLGWFVSIIVGGGSSLILMPIVGIFLGAQAIPPIITIGGIFGNAERIYVYWSNVNWKILKWEIPAAVVGALLGAFTLSKLDLEWLTIIVAAFLIISAISSFLKKNEQSFTVKMWYFIPGGFIHAFLSGLIGSMGPILAPFYINYGLKKEELLATQAIDRLVVHCIKLIAYGVFGMLQLPYIGYGLVIGLASFPGNWLGGLVLEKISERLFRQLVFSFVMFSGFFIFWEHRQVVGF